MARYRTAAAYCTISDTLLDGGEEVVGALVARDIGKRFEALLEPVLSGEVNDPVPHARLKRLLRRLRRRTAPTEPPISVGFSEKKYFDSDSQIVRTDARVDIDRLKHNVAYRDTLIAGVQAATKDFIDEEVRRRQEAAHD